MELSGFVRRVSVLHIGFPRAGSSFIQDEILARSDASHVLSSESMGFDWHSTQTERKGCWENAARLAKEYPDSKVIIITRSPGEWLHSWWRHHTGGLTEIGTKSFHEAMKTSCFDEQIAPHLSGQPERAFQEHFGFQNVHVIPFDLLRRDPETFVSEFCKCANIPVPGGIQYRKVNASRSHAFCCFRVFINRAWVRFGFRRWDNAYLYFIKHYVARIDGLFRKGRLYDRSKKTAVAQAGN